MLAAILACRNQSSRMYAKPLQNLDVENRVSILDYLVAQLKMRTDIEAIVLAISDREENIIYKKKSKEYDIPYILGDERDMLGRLIKGAQLVGADTVFRVTTESPFQYLDNLAEVFAQHLGGDLDFSVTKELPGGAYFQLIKTEALKRCWNEGGEPYRNEYCTKYIFDNREKFKIKEHAAPPGLGRQADIRLTVDWPEDLIVARKVYKGAGLHPSKPFDLLAAIQFLDEHPRIKAVNNRIDNGKRIW